MSLIKSSRHLDKVGNTWDIDVKEKVYQRLANEIFFRIYNGTYRLGSKLPSYINIAKEAGSSPETVRKALFGIRNLANRLEKRCLFYLTQSSRKN